jgi:hypothetical protein
MKLCECNAMRYEFTVGDIIILNGGKRIVCIGEKIVRKSARRSGELTATHLAIVANYGQIIHSTPKDGVDIIPVNDFAHDYKDRVVGVYRHRQIAESQELKDKLNKSLMYSYKKGYNYGMLIELERNSFCSEFVAQSFRDANLELKCKKLCLPTDIQELCISDTQCFEDVTQSFNEFLNGDLINVLASSFEALNILLKRGHNGKIELAEFNSAAIELNQLVLKLVPDNIIIKDLQSKWRMEDYTGISFKLHLKDKKK